MKTQRRMKANTLRARRTKQFGAARQTKKEVVVVTTCTNTPIWTRTVTKEQA